MRTRLLSTLLLAFVACRTAGPEASPGVEPESGPPPPFTAAEIRAGNPPGTERTFEIVHAQGPPRMQTVRFVEGPEDELAHMRVTTTNADEPETFEATATWMELRNHASFPPDKTTRVPATWSTRAGDFEGWLYVVDDERDGQRVVSRYWFAHDEPGPPVLLEQEANGQTTMRSELTARERPE